MPPVVAAVAALYAAYGTIVATAIIASVVISAASLAYAGYTMASMPGYPSDIQGRTQVVRSAVAPHRIVYGECPVSGPLVASFSHGTPAYPNYFLYLVIVLASHEVEDITSVWLESNLASDEPYWNLGGTNSETHVVGSDGTVATNPIGVIASVTKAVTTTVDNGDGTTSTIIDWEPLYPFQYSLVDNVVYSPSGVRVASKIKQQINFDPSLAGATIMVTYYRSFVGVTRYFGTQEQPADPELMSMATDEQGNLCWTANHTLTGRAYLVVRLEYNASVFSSGIPNIKALVKGKNDIFDPRLGTPITNVISGTMRGTMIILHPQITCPGHGFSDGATVYIEGVKGAVEVNGGWIITLIDADNFFLAEPSPSRGWTSATSPYTGGGLAASTPFSSYTNNAALCMRDYLLKPHGLNCAADEVNDANFITAANICDEDVVVLAGTGAGYTTDTKGYAVGSTALHLINGTGTILPGDTIAITVVGGWYFAGLFSAVSAAGYTFYPPSSEQYTVATNPLYTNDPGLDPFGNLTLSGTGIRQAIPPFACAVTVMPDSHEPRYQCNGSFTLDKTPSAIIKNMLTACAGRLTWSQGMFSMFPAAYNYPTVTLTESDLRDSISVTPAPSLRQRMNTVRGTFVSPIDYWQQIDFPVVRDMTAFAQDGNVELVQNLELGYTTSPAAAQRLANIFLQQNLHGMIVHFPGKLTCFRLQPGDVVDLNIAELGWVGKQFRITEWTLAENGGVDLVMQEESPDIYGWLSSQQTAVSYPPAAFVASGTPLAVYADNAAAVAAGLTVGQPYKTPDGITHLVY